MIGSISFTNVVSNQVGYGYPICCPFCAASEIEVKGALEIEPKPQEVRRHVTIPDAVSRVIVSQECACKTCLYTFKTNLVEVTQGPLKMLRMAFSA